MAKNEVATTGGNLMSLMGISEGRALKSFDDLIDGQSYEPMFQGVHQIGGITGGVLEANRGTNEDIDLPEGRRGFTGIYLGHRFSFTGWKTGRKSNEEIAADKEAGIEDDDEVGTPAYGGSVSPIFNPSDARLLKDACSAYQFTKKVDKHKFDFATSQAGHIRANCELLLYYADADQAITVSTPYYYDSVFGKEGMLWILKGLVDREAGGILPVPYKVAPTTKTKMIGSNEVGVHTLPMSPVSDTKASQAYDKFKDYAALLESDEGAGERAKIESWLNCTDRETTDGMRQYMKNATALGN